MPFLALPLRISQYLQYLEWEGANVWARDAGPVGYLIAQSWAVGNHTARAKVK